MGIVPTAQPVQVSRDALPLTAGNIEGFRLMIERNGSSPVRWCILLYGVGRALPPSG